MARLIYGSPTVEDALNDEPFSALHAQCLIASIFKPATHTYTHTHTHTHSQIRSPIGKPNKIKSKSTREATKMKIFPNRLIIRIGWWKKGERGPRSLRNDDGCYFR